MSQLKYHKYLYCNLSTLFKCSDQAKENSEKENIPLRPRQAKKFKTQSREVCLCHSLIQSSGVAKFTVPFTYLTKDIKRQSLSFDLRLDSYTNNVSKPCVIWHLKYYIRQMFFVNVLYKSLGYSPEKNLMPNVTFLANLALIYLVKLPRFSRKSIFITT